MSPNGDLVAYSTPADLVELRDQAALISMAWRGDPEGGYRPNKIYQSSPNTLRALTIELGNLNIIARAVQYNLIVVLLGGVFPGKSDFFKLTKENFGDDATYPLETPGRVTTLQLQRRKVDTVAKFIEGR